MIQIPGSEDSTVREVIWTPWRGYGIEHLRLIERHDEIEADALVVDTYELGVFRLRYRIICDSKWHVRRVNIGLIGTGRELDLSADGEGNWLDSKSLPVSDLDTCIDVDISGSPFTNTLPIRRLGLRPGQSADVPIAYIYIPTLQLERHMQRYTCLEVGPEGGLYRFEALDLNLNTNFTTVLSVDKNGLVMDYPELSRRSWMSESIRKGDVAN